MKDKFISALSSIKSGQRVFIHSVAAAPALLIDALAARANELSNVEIIHLHTEGKAPYAEPGMEGKFFTNALFVAANTRRPSRKGEEIIFQFS
ncbi:hypothetical protein LEP1GSC016_1073 [Leptospira borgpetersenii serovar Hardjo-bovis str. Sponselee]|uniref:4-hydroxybutyrate CoA-transferase n=1 Tax=Leptospira borgpetersenii serovar Hardjo-bovis str. Sponselee TaxID=1303729 RepID=M6BP76_LEPBO|nr:hypothetical protein LEP1GSC016_1073 [Leptospira borgpetersenii serovar Hardjo-bovis str. Sponselee]